MLNVFKNVMMAFDMYKPWFHTCVHGITEETLDHVKRHATMRVKVGVRSRVAQAGRNHQQRTDNDEDDDDDNG